MTWEESAEFVRHSIESHDRQLGELTDRMAETDRRIAETSAQIKETDRLMREGWARTDLNFDRLTTAMTALTEHVGALGRRVEKLEGH